MFAKPRINPGRVLHWPYRGEGHDAHSHGRPETHYEPMREAFLQDSEMEREMHHL